MAFPTYRRESDGSELSVHVIPGSEGIRATVNGVLWGYFVPSKDDWHIRTGAAAFAEAELKLWVRAHLQAFGATRQRAFAKKAHIRQTFFGDSQ